MLSHSHVAISSLFQSPFARFRRNTPRRWRTFGPPTPPYPGFLLHFL